VAALAAAAGALALSHGSSSPAHRASAKAAPAQQAQFGQSAQTSTGTRASKAAQAGASRGAAAHANPHSSATRSSPSATVHAREAANLVRDPEEANSFPAPASVKHSSAAAPARAGQAIVAAGAPSDAEVRAELKQMESVERAARSAARQRLAPVAGGRSIGGNGAIAIPQNVPEVVQRVIAGANAIADFPYVFGGGHASFVDNAYDCSGSVSYALAAGGLLGAPETSGELESWGAPGPGRYITVMANAGHTYMYVNGVMYNTSGRSGVYASRWQVGSVDNSGYVARHWPGL
jgi:cell wall-associated NlpC family hydrolase